MLFDSSCVLFPQLLSWGSVDVPALLEEVTQAREATTTLEATRVAAILAVDTSAQEATAARDSATPAERKTLETVSRAEVENGTT
jgi:hypothetical protein